MKQTLLRFIILSFFGLIASFPSEGQTFLMDGSDINACSGFFLDSGGENANYSPNETFITTFCADTSQQNYIQLRFSGIELGVGDRLCFYDGTDTLASLIQCFDASSQNQAFIIQASAANPTGCLTVVFTSDTSVQGSGWQSTISCINRCQMIEANLSMTSPEIFPADTGYIDLCPGESVSFTGAGSYPQSGVQYVHSDQSSSFEWDFGDGSTALGPQVLHQYKKPGGYTVQLTITDQFGCQNTNFINQRVRVSGPPQFIKNTDQNELAYCFGDTIQLAAQLNRRNDSLELSILSPSRSFQSAIIRSDSLPLPDGDGQAYESSVYVSGFSPGQTLDNVNELAGICLNIEHSWLRDLEITLFCPSGDSAIVHNHIGKTGSEVFLGSPIDNDEPLIPGTGAEYCWSAGATNPSWLDYIDQNPVSSLPPGFYQPAQPLDPLLGCPLNGEWILKVEDLWQEDNGIIFSWGINFSPEIYPNLETFSNVLSASEWITSEDMIDQTDSSFTAVPDRSGINNYTISVTDDFGCVYDTSLQVEVLPPNQLFCVLRDTLEQGPLLQDTVICQGGGLMLDLSLEYPDTTPLSFEIISDYTFGHKDHPHNSPYRSVIQVDEVFPDTLTEVDSQIVSVCVDLETDWADDIRFFLEAPNGTRLELSTDNGGDGDNYSQTCFTPLAADSIISAQAPFTGNFQPEGNWADLDSGPINGSWALLVSDGAGLNEVGRLNSWSITFNTQNEIRYQWLPDQDISCTDCDMPVFTPSSTTDYTLILSDNYGQEYRDTFTLEVSTQPCTFQECMLTGIVLDQVSPTCANSRDGQLQLTASGGPGPYEFRINNSLITGDTVTFNSLNAGALVVTITDQAACVDTLIVELLQADSFRLDLSVERALSCSDATDAIVAGAVQGGQLPYQFSWRGQASNTNRLENVGAGTYTLVVEDGNGCLLEDSIEVVALLPLTLDFDRQPPLCANTTDGSLTALPLGGEGPYSFQWSTGSTGNSIDNLGAGQYEVIVTDSRGCQETATAELMSPSSLQIDSFSITPINCFGGDSGTAQVWVSGGTGPYAYQWNDMNGQTDSIASGLMSGTYQVSISDQNGCEVNGEVSLTGPEPLLVDLIPEDVQCQGNADGSITVSATGGTMPYSYDWSNDETGPAISNLTSGTYRLTLTDARGCQIQRSAVLSEPDAIFTLTVEQVQQACFGEKNNVARVTTTGGNGPFEYLWNDGQNSALAQGLDSLVYSVRVTDRNGCFAVDSIKLQDLEPLVPNIIISPPSCRGTANGALGINFVEGGFGGELEDYTFSWSNGASGSFVEGLIGGEEYEVTVTDPGGCQAIARRTMTEAVRLSYDVEITPVQCFGERNGRINLSNLTGQGQDFRIRWDIVSGGENLSAQNLAAGSYSFTITDAANCSIADTVKVAEPAPILIDFNIQNIDCFSDSRGRIEALVRGGTSPYEYAWSNQESGVGIDNLSAGTYTLSVTDGNGCQQVESATIEQPTVFQTTVSTKMPTCQGDRNGAISIEVTGGTPPYQYSLDNSNFQLSNAFLGLPADTYAVYIKDQNECASFETVTLQEPEALIIQASPQNARIRIGESLQLQADHANGAGNVRFFWEAPYEGTLSCTNCSDPISTPGYSITYELIGTDENGCTGNDFLNIFVEKPREVLVPTGFTPNNDGLNDVLIVHGDTETLIRSFQIFDRWGSLVFESGNFRANEEAGAWNGRYQNGEAGNGVYVWVVEAEFSDGSTEVFKGQTSLIR
jgi:gliding motility-associated-like protein